MLGRTAAERLVRDHVVVPMMNRRFVQRLIAEASSQLRVSYRHGPLGSRRPGWGLRPGDRVPGLSERLLGRWGLVGGDLTEVEARVGAVVRLRGPSRR